MFNKILGMLTLTDEDRQELKANRGFTDETIDHFKFKSPLTPAEAVNVVEEIGKGPLQKARLLDGSTLIPAFTRNGLIPYHEEGNCVRIKGHKYGLPGTAPIIFRATREDQDTLYLCESEYKAAAMWQLGYSAVGLCGISTFINKHFKTLLETLIDIRPKKCVVVFDNDDKSSPESSKFSSDPKGRYDCFKYQWYIASLLNKKGIDAVIANLPDSWRVNGGCDIDGALANGKTRKDFEKFVGEAAWLTPDEFKDSWIGTGEMDEILTPWADAKLRETQVKIKNNCMWSTDKRGEPLKLTNFDMEITTIYVSENDSIESRFVTVVNEYGRRFPEVEMLPKDLTTSAKFSEWCLRHQGNLVYSGEARNLHEVSNYINTVSAPSIIKSAENIGYHEKTESFIADNVAYQDGKMMNVSENRVFLKDQPIMVKQIEQGSKAVNINISNDPFDWREAIEKHVENYGDAAVRIPIVWCLASLLADVFERVTSPKMFPILWITGAMGSGKNTLISHMLSFIGINGHEGLSVSQITMPMLWKRLSFYSCIPVWIDELRANKQCAEMDGIWRSIYNRTCVSKSKLNTDGEILSSRVRGSLILSGQDISADAALNQRFIAVEVSKATRRGTQYNWIKNNCHKFSYAAHQILSKRDEIAELIEKNYDNERKKWKELIYDDRMAGNIAIVTTMAKAINVDIEKDFNFQKWVGASSDRLSDTSDDMRFMDAIETAIKFDPDMIARVFRMNSRDKGIIFMDYKTAHKMLEMNSRVVGDNLGVEAIITEMLNSGMAKCKTTGRVKDAHGNDRTVRGVNIRAARLRKELIDIIANPGRFSTRF